MSCESAYWRFRFPPMISANNEHQILLSWKRPAYKYRVNLDTSVILYVIVLKIHEEEKWNYLYTVRRNNNINISFTWSIIYYHCKLAFLIIKKFIILFAIFCKMLNGHHKILLIFFFSDDKKMIRLR